jgi:thymidine kinase
MSSHDSIKIPCIRTKKLSDIFDVNLYLMMKQNGKDYSYIINNIMLYDSDTNDDNVSNKINIIKSLIDNTHPTFTRTILINEGQFFPDIFDWVKYMVTYLNKRVYIAGLDGDFKQLPIGDILHLIPYSNKCTKLTSLCYDCRDGTEAIFSHRITNETEQIVIGSDNYIPLCRECYNKRNKVYESNNKIISSYP